MFLVLKQLIEDKIELVEQTSEQVFIYLDRILEEKNEAVMKDGKKIIWWRNKMSKKYSIAIVDDETEILNVLSRFLTRNPNFSVNTYSNPVSAVASVDNSKYDLILLDIMMPQMNGLEALEK